MTEYDAHRIIVVLIDKQGNAGVGEIATLNIPVYKAGSDIYTNLTLLEKHIIPSIIKYQKKKSITTIDQLTDSYSWIKGGNLSKSGLEMAMWHLISIQKKTPVHKLFGGTNLTIECGDSIGVKTISNSLNQIEKSLATGFKRIKVKIWPGLDINLIKQIRTKFPNIPLQVDANSAYKPTDWKTLKKLDEFNLLMIEQPLADDDIINHAFLSSKLKTPICLDESINSADHANRAITLWKKLGLKNKLIINIKPPRVGGYKESIKIAKACYKNSVPVWCGGMLETTWGKYFNLCLNSRSEFALPGDHHGISGGYFKKDFSSEKNRRYKGEYSLQSHPKLNMKKLEKITINKYNYKN